LLVSDDLDIGLARGIGDTLHDEQRLIATINITQKFEQHVFGRIVPYGSRLSNRTKQWGRHSRPDCPMSSVVSTTPIYSYAWMSDLEARRRRTTRSNTKTSAATK
jgi:hypothetical protein